MQSLPTFSLKNIGDRNHYAFTKLLRSSNIFSPNNKHVVVSFRGLESESYLAIDDLALLTAHIRNLAQRDCRVTLQWPRTSGMKTTGRMQKVLNGLRYSGLFARNKDEVWTQNIEIEGRPKNGAYFNPNLASANYLPAQWIDARSLGIDIDKTSDLWTARPRVPQSVNTQFRTLLQSQGFLDNDAIDSLIHVIFMEIGWNAVLHSGTIPGLGFAVFCGQVENKSIDGMTVSKLTFCFADSGRGIPNSLGLQFDLAQESPDRQYERIYNCSRETAIIRFALDRDSTSRPRHASISDAEGCRGLAYVTQALEGRGRMRIRSGGGSLSLLADPSGSTIELESFPEDHLAIPGTTAIGEIYARSTRSTTVERGYSSVSDSPVSVSQVIDLSNLLTQDVSAEETLHFLSRNATSNENVLVLDLAYRELSPRAIESICKSASMLPSLSVCVLWNARIEWSVLKGLGDWATAESLKRRTPTIVMVKRADDVRVLSNTADAINDCRKLCPWIGVNRVQNDDGSVSFNGDLKLSDWFAVSGVVNSHRISRSFKLDDTEAGCYTGSIHLLSGQTVTHYFSFAKNIQQHDGNLRVWQECVNAALSFLPKHDERPLVVLGFASTVRELVQFISTANADIEAHTILSYDLPSVEELHAAIRTPSNVVLLTDVLSTGSTASGLIQQLAKVDCKAIAVISTVDARNATGFHRSNLVLDETAYPIISCAWIDIREKANGLRIGSEYWVDPVSMVPQEKRADLWSLPRDVLDRIESTLKALESVDSVRFGHCVDGVRHMSIFIDIETLIAHNSTGVFSYVDKQLREQLKRRGWSDFNASHIISPTGVSRIESVKSSEANHVTVYRTAARLYANFLQQTISPNAELIEVLRSFDPGGNSRCAHIANGLVNSQRPLMDVIIADDGMWTGRTISSLLRGIVELGAKRVLIIPLLSRLRATESAHWESLTSVYSDVLSAEVSVCFFFPFLYPVPAYGRQDSPFVITAERIEKRAGELEVLRNIAERRKLELEARTPRETPLVGKRKGAFVARLRCYLELATEYEFALESARDMIDRLLANYDEEQANVCLDLFLLEWPLLDRARVRHTIGPLVRQLAILSIERKSASIEILKTAASFLRSRHYSDFISQLPTLTTEAKGNIDLLEQLLFHVATLSTDNRRSSSVDRFLRGVSELQRSDIEQLDDSDANRYQAILPIALQLLLENADTTLVPIAEETLQDSAAKLLEYIAEDGFFQHELRPFFQTLDEGRNNLASVSTATWREYNQSWKNTLQPFLANNVVSRISVLSRVLRRSLTPPQSFTDGDTEYICRSGLQTFRTLVNDIAIIQTGLRQLSLNNAFAGTVEAIGDASMRIRSAICGTRSKILEACSCSFDAVDQNSLPALARALIRLRSFRVQDLLCKCKLDIENTLAVMGKCGEIKIEAGDITYDRHWVFLPTDIVLHALAHIVLNLREHAWSRAESNDVKVKIQTSVTVIGSCLTMELTVRNSGREIVAPIAQGTDGRLLNGAMSIFEGAFGIPKSSSQPGYQADQSFQFKLWGAQLNEDSSRGRQKGN